MKTPHTTKKVKVIGTEQYLNISTGEVQNMGVVSIEERDFNFHKVWMRNFISTLEIIGNQKAKVCFWIIDNLNKENQLLYTYRGISDATGISLDTVAKTMKVLLDADFLRKGDVGYIINPDILFKGSRSGRMNILNEYHSQPYTPISNEKKIKNLEQIIAKLQHNVDVLKKQEQEKIIKTEEPTEEPIEEKETA